MWSSYDLTGLRAWLKNGELWKVDLTDAQAKAWMLALGHCPMPDVMEALTELYASSPRYLPAADKVRETVALRSKAKLAPAREACSWCHGQRGCRFLLWRTSEGEAVVDMGLDDRVYRRMRHSLDVVVHPSVVPEIERAGKPPPRRYTLFAQCGKCKPYAYVPITVEEVVSYYGDFAQCENLAAQQLVEKLRGEGPQPLLGACPEVEAREHLLAFREVTRNSRWTRTHSANPLPSTKKSEEDSTASTSSVFPSRQDGPTCSNEPSSSPRTRSTPTSDSF